MPTGIYLCLLFGGIFRIVLSIVEFLVELNEWGPIFTLWSNSEDKVSLALGAIAKAVEKNFIALEELVRYPASSCTVYYHLNLTINSHFKMYYFIDRLMLPRQNFLIH